MSIKKNRILVTGISRGIGEEITRRLLSTGYVVHGISRSSPCEEFIKNESFHFHQCDLGHIPNLGKVINDISYLKFDALINNAAVNIVEETEKIQNWQYEDLMNINLRAPFELTRRLVSENQKIVNISSISGLFGLAKHRSLYVMSKHALNGLTKQAAIDYGHLGILVNSVCPGPIETDMTEANLTSEQKRAIVDKIPLGRLGTVEEVAKLVLFLISENNTYITGQNIVIDGGVTCSWY